MTHAALVIRPSPPLTGIRIAGALPDRSEASGGDGGTAAVESVETVGRFLGLAPAAFCRLSAAYGGGNWAIRPETGNSCLTRKPIWGNALRDSSGLAATVRDGGVWTPSQARYQAAPQPVNVMVPVATGSPRLGHAGTIGLRRGHEQRHVDR